MQLRDKEVNYEDTVDKESSLLLEEESSEDELQEKAKCTCQWSHLGIFFAVLSGIFFSLCAVIVKYIKNVHPIHLAFYRFLGIFIPSALLAAILRVNPFPKGTRVLFLIRCIAGCLSLSLQFYAFRHMDIGDASVIIFSNPVFVAILARIILREHFSPVSVITLLATIIGVVCIVRPSFIFNIFDKYKTSSNEFSGILAAISSLVFSSVVYVVMRQMKSVHFAAMLVTYGFISMIITGIISIPLNGFNNFINISNNWLLILLMSLFSFAGQILLTFATKVEAAGPVSLGRSSDIVCAYLFQTFYFHETPTPLSLIGMILITGSVVLMGIHKWLQSLPNNSNLKAKCRCLS